MDSSEAPVDGIGAAARPTRQSTLTQQIARVPGDWVALAVALVAPWWLPLLATAVPTFYKECADSRSCARLRRG